MILSLVPAYGRLYASLDGAVQDWKAGKDFKIANGPYCSIRDTKRMQEMGYVGVRIHIAKGSSISIQLETTCQSKTKT